jgi:murein DD-endopeptidase MepM/ murein hydrolase activator NlpD
MKRTDESSEPAAPDGPSRRRNARRLEPAAAELGAEAGLNGPPAAGREAKENPGHGAPASGVEATPDAASAQAGASRPLLPSTVRIVASVVDPSVRQDGRGDPQFILHGATATRADGAEPTAPQSGHPVRDRLLAKARAAAAGTSVAGTRAPSPEAPEHSPPDTESSEATGDSWFAERVEAATEPTPATSPSSLGEAPEGGFLGFEALPQSDDLDSIGAPEPLRPPRPQLSPGQLTPSAALLLGTLFGVTGLAVLFAVLIEVAPHAPWAPVAAPAAPEVALPPAAAVVAPRRVPSLKRAPRQPVEAPWRIADVGADAQYKRVEASVGMNSFLGAIQAAGVSVRDAYRVMTAFQGVKDLNKCRPKDDFSALLDTGTGRLTAFEYVVSDEEVYQARESKQGLLVAQKLDLRVRRDRVEGAILVQGGFEESSRRAGFDPGLADVLNKALAGYANVNELRDGDVLALVAQEVTVLGRFSRYAGVEALEYRALGADPIRIYYHESEKKRGYVDSRGRGLGKSRWVRPVAGAAVTSRFNPKRRHPILKIIKPHNGTDFGAVVGTPVQASAAGRVSFVGVAGPNGNMVRLAHAGGYETGYSHLSRFAKGLKPGALVEQKQLIGYVGSTGRSTGPHLHFSVKKNSRFVDPETLNLDAMSRLAQAERQLLQQLRQRYDGLLNAIVIPEPPPRVPEAVAAAAPKPAVPDSVSSAAPPLDAVEQPGLTRAVVFPAAQDPGDSDLESEAAERAPLNIPAVHPAASAPGGITEPALLQPEEQRPVIIEDDLEP